MAELHRLSSRTKLRARWRGRTKPWRCRRPWCESRRRDLRFKRTDVHAAVYYAIKPRAALIVRRRRGESGFARIDGRAAGQQRVGESRTAIVLQRAERGIGVDLIARSRQVTAAIVTA